MTRLLNLGNGSSLGQRVLGFGKNPKLKLDPKSAASSRHATNLRTGKDQVSRPGTFQKGKSGNPGGRPKEVAEVKALARTHTTTAINTLVSIAASKNATDAARVSACIALLDRGWGKPDKTHHHDGDMRQHIISDRPLTPDEWTAKYCRA
jgi:hypothetical protein